MGDLATGRGLASERVPGPAAVPGAVRAARMVRSGQASAAELAELSLGRIAHREPEVRAWAQLDPAGVRARLSTQAHGARGGPLAGVCVGVKDVIDTADFPTEYGSPIWAGHRPRADAACVHALQAAGATVVGKTVTTELAFVDPAPTRNPLAGDRTPGASSAGSAAAVADGMVPIALGTQSAASTVRPAAYCGVLGFKPTIGAISTAGVKPSSPALDTVGIFAREVGDLKLAYGVLAEHREGDLGPLERSPRIGVIRTAQWQRAEIYTQQIVLGAAERLAAAGAAVREVDSWPALDALPEAHERLAAYDLARSLAYERRHGRDQLGPAIRQAIEIGLATSTEQRATALRHRDRAAASLGDAFDRCDVLLAPAVTGEAPPRESTGDPAFGRAWTLLGLPCLCLPAGLGPAGLPVGVQLIGRRGTDRRLLQIAEWVLEQLGPIDGGSA